MSNIHSVHRSRAATKLGMVHVRGFVNLLDAPMVKGALAIADADLEAYIKAKGSDDE